MNTQNKSQLFKDLDTAYPEDTFDVAVQALLHWGKSGNVGAWSEYWPLLMNYQDEATQQNHAVGAANYAVSSWTNPY